MLEAEARPSVGVSTVVLRHDGQVLLTKREDFEVWCLPGGGVDGGESLAQAAVREVREETGLEVRLTGLVGLYSRPDLNSHLVVFAAEPLGGALRLQPFETIEVGYFPPDGLPEPLIWWQRQPILDALAGRRGVVWTLAAPWPLPAEVRTREDLYAFRDRSGLSRSEFYRRYFGDPGPDPQRQELG
ncbi:MAG TPA: NUDIX domain-containing protein [Chloroflexota bacterium]